MIGAAEFGEEGIAKLPYGAEVEGVRHAGLALCKKSEAAGLGGSPMDERNGYLRG